MSQTIQRITQLQQRLANPDLTPAARRVLQTMLNRLKSEYSTHQNSKDTSKDTNSSTPVEVTLDIPSMSGITYTEEQQHAINLALQGHSLILTGAAGTGKTTVLHGITTALIKQAKVGVLEAEDHKHLRSGGPGIVLISFTNKAVENAKKRMPLELRPNCITAHKLLEYEPEYQEFFNPDTGETTTTMRFVPTRGASRTNPSSIRTLIIEETTLVDVPLWNKIIESLPPTTPDLQVILVGDIQQLPPVFGKSIFIHAMQWRMKTVELTQVHRQAEKSPILKLAHRILSGRVIPGPEFPEWDIDTPDGKLTIRPWKQRRTIDFMSLAITKLFPALIDSGEFNPEEDIILCPWGKSLGVELINTIVASHHAKQLNAEVYEVIAGFQKLYLRIGERVLHNKTGHRVVDIQPNRSYFGAIPRPASTTMDYNGIESDQDKLVNFNSSILDGDNSDMVDAMLESMAAPVDEDNPRRRQASHRITVVSDDTGERVVLSTAGELNDLLLGYALTVHRAQGSEWDKVIIFLHHAHAAMLFRELLYTAVTRAKKELLILCETNSLVAGITNQRLPGKNVQEKIHAFEQLLVQQARAGTNDDQMPNDLHRFIPQTTGLQE